MDLLMMLTCCLPANSTIAGAVCATATYIVRKKLKKKKRSSHDTLQIKFTPKPSKTYLKGYFNVTARSAPAKQDTSDHWRSDLLDIVSRYNVYNEVSFNYALPVWKQERAEKVAEGAYGEIYRFPHFDGSWRILKLIALANMPLTLAISDIVCSVSLSMLNKGNLFKAPNFPDVYRVCIVKDESFPRALMDAWSKYERISEATDPTQYPRPDLYGENSRFLTLESSYCGNPLSKQFETLQNAWVGATIMTQLVAALAVAEESCCFEHRDLHVNNILIKETQASQLNYTLRNDNNGTLNFSVKTAWHQVFIIDFTFSRLNDGSKIYSVPLSESSISPQESWLDHKHLYKKMLDILKGDYDKYSPKTNILWLKYVNENIIHCLYEKERPMSFSVAIPSVGSQMAAMRMLRKFNDVILNYNSSKDFLKDVVLFENSLVKFDKP